MQVLKNGAPLLSSGGSEFDIPASELSMDPKVLTCDSLAVASAYAAVGFLVSRRDFKSRENLWKRKWGWMKLLTRRSQI